MKYWFYKFQNSFKDNRGISTVEILLLIVIAITVVMIFKEQIIDLVEDIMDKITKQAMRV